MRRKRVSTSTDTLIGNSFKSFHPRHCTITMETFVPRLCLGIGASEEPGEAAVADELSEELDVATGWPATACGCEMSDWPPGPTLKGNLRLQAHSIVTGECIQIRRSNKNITDRLFGCHKPGHLPTPIHKKESAMSNRPANQAVLLDQGPLNGGSVSDTSSVNASTAKRSGAWFDRLAILLATWLVGGVYLDGWAHNHIARLETFFTPWHAVLYSGYASLALFLVITAVRNHQPGQPWRLTVPAGYGLSLTGAGIFAVAGVLDLTWHTLFGIERSIEALFSPTHLMLGLGAMLMVTGPLRAATFKTPRDVSRQWVAMAPAILSLTYLMAFLVFFTQYAHPIVKSLADLPHADDFTRGAGVADILIQSAILMGVALVAVKRWQLPFGTFAVLLGVTDGLAAVLAASSPVLSVVILGALTGLLVDLLNLGLRPRMKVPASLRVFAFAAPVATYTVYFAALASLNGVHWSLPIWTGSIVEAGVVGLLLSYVLISPLQEAASAKATTTA